MIISSKARAITLLFVTFSMLFFCGCGNDDRMKTGAVRGTVSLDGKPLNLAEIIFYSEKRMGLGDVVEGNIINVTTYATNDGVPLGTHQVAIRPKIDEAAMMSPPKNGAFKADSSVPVKYQNAETSGLTAQINKGENELTFELTSN